MFAEVLEFINSVSPFLSCAGMWLCVWIFVGYRKNLNEINIRIARLELLNSESPSDLDYLREKGFI